MALIRLCSGFPTDWPGDRRERFSTAINQHWPSVQLRADPFSGDLDRARLAVPALTIGDMADGDIIAWLDPDIEAVSAVPSFVIPHLIKTADLCFIVTDSGEIDLTFWAARLGAATRGFIAALAAAPAGDVQAIWNDKLAAADLDARDLTPGGYGGSWALGPLGRYTRRMNQRT